MSKGKSTIAQAVQQAGVARGHLRAKGFKHIGDAGELRYSRNDADLHFDMTAGRWVCDVYTTQDGQRIALLTRKAAPMLAAVLNSIL